MTPPCFASSSSCSLCAQTNYVNIRNLDILEVDKLVLSNSGSAVPDVTKGGILRVVKNVQKMLIVLCNLYPVEKYEKDHFVYTLEYFF